MMIPSGERRGAYFLINRLAQPFALTTGGTRTRSLHIAVAAYFKHKGPVPCVGLANMMSKSIA